jgi:hypothetical protein
MLDKLKGAGYEVDDPAEKVADLAAEYGVAPSDLFAALQRGGAGGPGTHGGAGMGRRTVQAVCQERNVALDAALRRLRDAGIDASGSDTLRSLAEQSGKTPMDVAEVLSGR